MSLDNIEDAVKVIVVGNGQVGKSSLVRRYCKGEFTSEYKKTIGADFLEKDVFIKGVGQTVKMMLWDTAGQEVYDALTSQYYRGAGACVLAFSTTDRESFLALKTWKEKVENVCGRGNVVLCMIQTKIDLIQQAVVQSDEAEATARALGVKFFRTSTLENYNIDPVFEYLAEQYLNRDQPVADPAMDITHGAKGGAKDTPAAAAAPRAAAVKKTDEQSSAPISLASGNEKPATTRAKHKKRCKLI